MNVGTQTAASVTKSHALARCARRTAQTELLRITPIKTTIPSAQFAAARASPSIASTGVAKMQKLAAMTVLALADARRPSRSRAQTERVRHEYRTHRYPLRAGADAGRHRRAVGSAGLPRAWRLLFLREAGLMRRRPQFGSNATAICIGGYVAAVGFIFLAMLVGPPLALRCARLDVEGR